MYVTTIGGNIVKLVIFGSRPKYCPLTLNQQVDLIAAAVKKFQLQPSLIVTGLAQGIDTAAVIYARGLGIPIEGFRPDWVAEPRAAGFIRNKQMAMYADAGLGLQWGNSSGTQHMIETMRALRKPLYTVHDGELDYAF